MMRFLVTGLLVLKEASGLINCSVLEATRRASGLLLDAAWVTHNHSIHENRSPEAKSPRRGLKGAIVTAWWGDGAEELHVCQNRSRAAFAATHGLSYYTVVPSDLDDVPGLDAHFLKLFALKKVLPNHAWVLWMDMDAIFTAPWRRPKGERDRDL